MFWSSQKLPINQAQQEWIEASLLWLLDAFGRDFLMGRPVILPEPSFFPDAFHGTEACVRKLTDKICVYLAVDPNLIEVEVFSVDDFIGRDYRIGENQYTDAAGLYFHKPQPNGKRRIAINSSQLSNPTGLVATIAHELGHFILLGEERLAQDYHSGEPLTDLLTVFHGMGIFTANAVIQFSQWQDYQLQGWKISRQGYMTEEMFGYSLAGWAWMRGDVKAEWQRHLTLNVREYFKTSLKYLSKAGETTLKPIISK